MGTLTYGNSGQTIHFDDRALAHIQIVVAAKLRRNEGFFFTWQQSPAMGSGHNSVWLHSSIPLVFKFGPGGMPAINREWLEKLTLSANGANGMYLIPEPRAVARAESAATAAGTSTTISPPASPQTAAPVGASSSSSTTRSVPSRVRVPS